MSGEVLFCWQRGGLSHPSSIFFLFIFFSLYFNAFFFLFFSFLKFYYFHFFLMHRIRVSFLKVLTWTSVNFWTEVPFPSLAINNISSTIQNEPQETKNESIKSQRGQTYLALVLI
jgi:hypothetical protein